MTIDDPGPIQYYFTPNLYIQAHSLSALPSMELGKIIVTRVNFLIAATKCIVGIQIFYEQNLNEKRNRE